jgi:hypothetical protein
VRHSNRRKRNGLYSGQVAAVEQSAAGYFVGFLRARITTPGIK